MTRLLMSSVLILTPTRYSSKRAVLIQGAAGRWLEGGCIEWCLFIAASGKKWGRLVSPIALSSCFSNRTEEKKPLSPRTLPRRPYKVLLATLTNLYQQLDQSEKPGWEAGNSLTVSLQFGERPVES